MSTSKGQISTQNQAGTTYITFSAPPHNSLDSGMLTELADQIKAVGSDKETKVVVLQSGGNRAFCGGANLHEMMTLENIQQGKEFFMGFAKVILAIRDSPGIVICRAQGKAVGGGVGLAAAADYCLATKFAAIRLSELVIGIGPFVIEPAVTRRIGLASFTQLSINADRFFDATWAQAHGLFAELFDTAEAMDEAIAKLTETLNKVPVETIHAYKEMLRTGTEGWKELLTSRAGISGKLAVTPFVREKLRNFLG